MRNGKRNSMRRVVWAYPSNQGKVWAETTPRIISQGGPNVLSIIVIYRILSPLFHEERHQEGRQEES